MTQLDRQKMAWNEPGKKGDDNSPWSGKDAIPGLDGWLKKIQDKISGGSPGGDDKRSFWFMALAVAIFIVVIYIISGIYIVEPQEEGVVLQFGKYKETVMPGPHWVPRFINSAIVLDTQGIQNYSYKANMLTKDENIVDVAVAVQYRINNPENYLFNANNPIISLQQATASSLRQVIGHTNLDNILTSGREQVSQDVRKQLIRILGSYKTGIEITEVALQPAKAPEAVKDAFDDAIKAQEDEQRYINQAQAYRMQVIPQANGNKQRILANANAYKQQVVLNSQGETARYLALLPQYLQNPEVTRERLYLGALQNVFTRSTKIFVDQRQGNNTLMYLPLDKLVSAVGTSKTNASSNNAVGQVPLAVPTQNTTSSGSIVQTSSGSSSQSNFTGYGASGTTAYNFLSEGEQ